MDPNYLKDRMSTLWVDGNLNPPGSKLFVRLDSGEYLGVIEDKSVMTLMDSDSKVYMIGKSACESVDNEYICKEEYLHSISGQSKAAVKDANKSTRIKYGITNLVPLLTFVNQNS